MIRPPRALLVLVSLLAPLGCNRELSVPAEVVAPRITALVPPTCFSGETIRVDGSGFDPKAENNSVRFAGGLVTTPTKVSGGSLWVDVPTQVRDWGPIIVSNRSASSAPSAQTLSILGYGHPVVGNLVAELRFRHRPVGLVDRERVIQVASTLFDAVVDDAGAFTWADGRPVTFVRAANGGGLLSLRTGAGGVLQEFDVDAAAVAASSTVSDVVERLVLPLPAAVPPAAEPLVARTIGVDAVGRTWASTWRRTGTAGHAALVATRVALPVVEVLGAAVRGGKLAVVATVLGASGAETVLALVDGAGALSVVWRAEPLAEVPAIPAGPVVLASGPSSTPDAADLAVLALADGDLATIPLAGGAWQRTRMISFNPAGALVNAAAPGKVLLTKPADAALFQFDARSGALDWVVQLRGEPTAIDVAEDLGEIAVANAEENFIDVVDFEGVWQGRSSLSLGLGSADGGDGGVVAPYSYDPAAPQRQQLIQVLARTAPMVIDLDPNSITVLGTRPLDPVSPPLRLAVTPDLRTLVVHRDAIGLLEEEGERIVHPGPLSGPPAWVAFLRDGRVLLGSLAAVDVYQWQAGALARQASLALPAGTSVTGLVSHLTRTPGRDDHGDGGEDSLLVTWRGSAGLGGGFFQVPATVAAGAAPIAPSKVLQLATTLGSPVGLADLLDGPAALFGSSALPGPAMLSRQGLLGASPPIVSLASSPLVTRATPDGRFLVWVNEGSGEHVIRLLQYSDQLYLWAGYRFEAHAAGPGLDPSGEWLYVPVPKMDMLSVQQ